MLLNITIGAPFVIKNIELDGTVKLKAIDENGKEKGSLLKCPFELFVKKYEIGKKIRSLVNYPANDVTNNSQLNITILELQLSAAVLNFYKSKSPVKGISIFDKPRKGAFATIEFKKKDFVILIIGKVPSADSDDGVPAKSYEIKNHGISGRVFYITPYTYYQSAEEKLKEKCLALSIFLNSSKIKEESNLLVSWTTSQIFKKTPLENIKLPVFQNNVKVEPREELKLFVEEIEKAADDRKSKIPNMFLTCSMQKKPRTS